jgi:hypothetical protein
MFLIMEHCLSPYSNGWRPDNPDLWLTALVVLVLLRFTLASETVQQTSQVFIFLTGICFSKGILMWTRWWNDEVESRMFWIIILLVSLLAGAALWQPEMIRSFQYHDTFRWSGVWDNPNTYGLLMGTGLVLATSLIIGAQRWMLEDRYWFKMFSIILCSFLMILCGYGLFKSYSRGAWLAGMVGLIYLAILSIKASRFFDDFRRNSISLALLLMSLLALTFWQFRFFDWRPVQRVYSISNVNDLSWRNRVTAWNGAMQMMVDRPLVGFSWGNAEPAYQNNYCPQRLDESAAIQMNNFFMLAISAGLPALLCFVIYIWLNLMPKPPPADLDLLSPLRERRRGLQTTCRVGAIILLVGFWFDGGLFKLSVGPMFWVLMELSRLESPQNIK